MGDEKKAISLYDVAADDQTLRLLLEKRILKGGARPLMGQSSDNLVVFGFKNIVITGDIEEVHDSFNEEPAGGALMKQLKNLGSAPAEVKAAISTFAAAIIITMAALLI